MRVLLVDDHALIRSGIKDSLSKHYPDISLSEADSGRGAQELLAEQDFDLALVDLFIPGERLFSLVRECGRHPHMSVIVLSSSENPMHIRRCIDLGAVGYVSKSSSQRRLFNAIETVMAGGTDFPAPAPDKQTAQAAAQEFDPALLDYDQVKGILTPRQLEILALIARGQSNKEVANHLDLSTHTVKVHVSAILKALELKNRSQVAVLGEKLGLAPSGVAN